MRFRGIVFSFFIFFGPTLFAGQPDQVCLKWFKAGKIEAGANNCELSCAALATSMGTIICPQQCDRLCEPPGTSRVAGKLIFYPGLTPSEQQLVEKYPKDALIVFTQKYLAESSTSRNFPDQGLNDESDAFRHFLWAALLTKELGKTRAKEFLDAHESNPLQAPKEKEMDTFNNEKGVVATERLESKGQWNFERLEAAGLESLRSKELRVLKPGLKIPEKPK
ncbi:MAG: hypothetical protein ABL958_13205 [Bdellovibrionia bacterium]